ncbi:hypothetical protein [Variovorax sp. Root318D1]|uniref:hypothetical protein n=1 Tax=Variovorax sp. Root318D1 TaxID=1736513 RepID=UPI000A4C4778|nr:hypothetical protein [Variovorax sp. Root318D1]
MPSISFHPDFLTDLLSGDAQLPARVFRKILTDGGEFRVDRDDHPYRGIADGWIRVVSRGRTAFRVIYVKSKDHVMFYRAGQHKVEDDLASPNAATPTIAVKGGVEILDLTRPMGRTQDARELGAASGDGVESFVEMPSASKFLKNHEKRRLYDQIAGRRLIPHRDVMLVSPFISLDILWSTSPIGRALDEWIAEGCTVTLITRPPLEEDIAEFTKLEARGFSLIYVARLHAKAYFFKVDQTKVNTYQKPSNDLALLGSANLTNSGFHPKGELDKNFQLELSYELIDEKERQEFEDFITYLALVGTGHDVLKNNYASKGSLR